MNTKPKQLLPVWFYLNIEVVRNLEKPLLRFAQGFCLSHSQIEQMCKMAKDLSDWRELVPLRDFLRQQAEHLRSEVEGRKVSLQKIVAEQSSHNGDVILPQRRKQAMAELEAFYLRKKQILPNFQRNAPRPKVPKYRFEVLSGDPSHDPGDSALERVGETGKNAAWESAGERILGLCPVASVKTRCCNLLTLDAIQQCGFGCSYCAIQHFYDEKSIQVHGDFAQKLERLRLDPERWYHIGTGQSSDSLLWTEELGVLEPLIAFAERYPRVILELKSKSANVQNLLRRELPANMLFTWSLNPDSFVQHEELLTAPLDARLRSARALADRGAKVGFHFHPIVRYQGWKTEYAALASRLTSLFTAEEVVTVSLGTLTFSKSAMKTIRHKAEQTQILRFLMEDNAGKLSYPYEIKLELFRHVYQALSPWHNQVFFYLCMEDPSLWPEVFGWQYPSNQDFEKDMLAVYARKMALS